MKLTNKGNAANSPVTVQDQWRISLLTDNNLNDNSKDFTVPANTEYEVLSVRITVITTASIGNRQIVVEGLDGSGNILVEAIAGAVQTAGLTRYYDFAQGVSRLTDFVDTSYITCTLSPLFLAADWKLRVRDSKNIDANDDLLIQAIISERPL